MFKKTKLSSILFIAILILSIALTGCKSNEGTSNSGSTSGSGEKGGDSTDITMAFLTFSEMNDLPEVQEEINKITKEKINATVTLLPINISAWDQQINLMLTGNEKLDLLVTGAGFSYSTKAVKGQLIPLDDLLASHGQGILDVMPSYMLEATKVEGKTYGVPSMRDWAADYGLLMRKDLVEKHNIDLSQINSFEDLEPIFQTIKDNESGMNPIVNTTLTTASVIASPYFDILGDRLGVVEMDGDGTVINMFEHPDYVDAVHLARKWFEAGYLIKDAATSDEIMASLIKAGKGFGNLAAMKPGFEVQEQGLIGHEMTTVRLTEPLQYTTGATSFMMSITRNSQNPEKAMEMMNLLYTDADIMNLIANGVEGKHYTVMDEGVIALPEGVSDSGYVFGQWQIGNNYLVYPWEGNDPDYWNQMKEFNDSAKRSPVFGFSFNPDAVKTEIASATNVLDQYLRGVESGTLDPEKTLPEFNEKLKAAGLEKIIAEKQKQIDEWKANQ